MIKIFLTGAILGGSKIPRKRLPFLLLLLAYLFLLGNVYNCDSNATIPEPNNPGPDLTPYFFDVTVAQSADSTFIQGALVKAHIISIDGADSWHQKTTDSLGHAIIFGSRFPPPDSTQLTISADGFADEFYKTPENHFTITIYMTPPPK